MRHGEQGSTRRGMSHRRGLATLVALGVVSTTAATAHSYRVEHAAAPSESLLPSAMVTSRALVCTTEGRSMP